MLNKYPIFKFRKGNIPWNKGKHYLPKYIPIHFQKHSEETKKKMRLAHLNQHPKSVFKKNHISWNKGIKQWEGRIPPRLGKEGKKGFENPNWKGGISSQNKLERTKFRRKLQKLIFKRDNYRCQICESNKNLQVDHIASWAEFKELRFDPDNCRTLCAKCHYKITYGKEMPENIKTWGHNFRLLKVQSFKL